MKKRIIIVLSAFLVLVGAAYADHFDAVKKIGDVTVKTTIENNPLKVGDNNVTIALMDKNGESMTDAAVEIYYFMPSMPAMNYEVKTILEGETYGAVIKPTMPGAWDADIRVRMAGEDAQKVTIRFEAK